MPYVAIDWAAAGMAVHICIQTLQIIVLIVMPFGIMPYGVVLRFGTFWTPNPSKSYGLSMVCPHCSEISGVSPLLRADSCRPLSFVMAFRSCRSVGQDASRDSRAPPFPVHKPTAGCATSCPESIWGRFKEL